MLDPSQSGINDLWTLEKVPVNWKIANVFPVFKEGKKEDPGNSKAAGLTSVPSKMMEKIIPGV